jgi:hypothetical protein
VSSSVVLVSTQPVFVALLSGALLGERATRRQWVGIGIAVTGAMVIAWGDFALGPRAILGDALAIAGAVFVAIYFVIGRRLRPAMDLWWYIFIIYGIAALVLVLAIAIMPGVPLTGFPAQDWLVFAALAAGPMMLGHTAVNYALRYVRAYVANISLLGEPIGATLIAWLLPAIGEVPGPQTLVGGVLILGGIAVTVARGQAPAPGPPSAPGQPPAPRAGSRMRASARAMAAAPPAVTFRRCDERGCGTHRSAARRPGGIAAPRQRRGRRRIGRRASARRRCGAVRVRAVGGQAGAGDSAGY